MAMTLVGKRELILYMGLVPERWGSGKFHFGHFGAKVTATCLLRLKSVRGLFALDPE